MPRSTTEPRQPRGGAAPPRRGPARAPGSAAARGAGTLALYADPAFQSSAGIERYTRALIEGIRRSDFADRVLLMATRPEWVDALRGPEGVPGPRVARIPASPRLLRYAWSFAGAPPVERLAGEELGLVHTPSNIRTPTRRCPSVVTIHDVFITKLPELLSLRQRLVLTRALEAGAVRHADHIIAPSESTRADIVELYRIPGERITVVPLGVDHRVFRPVDDAAEVERVRARYGIPADYLLYVGSLYSRKLGNLLEAFRAACDRMDGPATLVLAGGRQTLSAGATPLEERVRALGLEGRVIVTGELPAGDVPVLMSAARAFVYVSFYEGFGLSPLEAMACGAPVVTSDVSSLPEVVGDAALRVDPADVADVAAAIAAVWSDAGRRAEMRRRSLRQAARFSWERTAEETFAVYARVAPWLF